VEVKVGYYFYGQIEIPARFIKGEVFNAVADEFGKTAEDLQEEIEANPNGILEFVDLQASSGEFPSLEGVLTEAMVPFDRNSAQSDGVAAERHYFRPPSACGRPGIEESYQETDDGYPYILVSELKDLITLDAEAVKEKLQQMIRDICVPESNPLSDWAAGEVVPAEQLKGILA
jgi:hypothetical protein